MHDHTCLQSQDAVFRANGDFKCSLLVWIVGESLDFLHYYTQWLESCLSPRKPFVSWQHFPSALVDSEIKSKDGIPAIDSLDSSSVCGGGGGSIQ